MRPILAAVLLLASLAAQAYCTVYPGAAADYCPTAAECPRGTTWTPSYCQPPTASGCYQYAVGQPIVCNTSPPPVPAPTCQIVITYTAATAKTPIIQPLEAGTCSLDGIMDAMVAALAAFRQIP